MPGSYLPDSDSETEYRVTEAVERQLRPRWEIRKKENKTDVDGTYPEFQFTNKAVTSLTVEKKWHTADAKKHPITMELWRTTDKNLIGKTGVDGVEQVAGMTAELSAVKAELAQYKSVRGKLRTADLEQENDHLRSRLRTYEDVISRNNLWHFFNGSRGKNRNRDGAR